MGTVPNKARRRHWIPAMQGGCWELNQVLRKKSQVLLAAEPPQANTLNSLENKQEHYPFNLISLLESQWVQSLRIYFEFGNEFHENQTAIS